METSKEESEPSVGLELLSKSGGSVNELSTTTHHTCEEQLLHENQGGVECTREEHNRLRKCSAEKKVRFVQSAESEETREVWETVRESRSECLRVTDLDDEESAVGAQSPRRHCCGSLYAQCGATRDTSLVTTYTTSSHEPVISLNEILAERNRMCRLGDEPMGNGVSSLGKDKGQGVYSVSKENVVGTGAGTGAGTVALLKREVQQWEEKSTELGEEVSALRKEARRKDHEILRLQREVHKLKVSKAHCWVSFYSVYIIYFIYMTLFHRTALRTVWSFEPDMNQRLPIFQICGESLESSIRTAHID